MTVYNITPSFAGSGNLQVVGSYPQFNGALWAGVGAWPAVQASRQVNAISLRIGAPIITLPECYQLIPGVVPYDYHVRRGADQYTESLAMLLPTGPAWPRDEDSITMQTVAGLAQIWGDVDRRAADLLEIESDPRTTVELLSDWEKAWGLPDPCFAGTVTSITQRQAILLLKMTFMGGASRNMFQAMAKQLGYEITITEYSPWMVGISWCGQWWPGPYG